MTTYSVKLDVQNTFNHTVSITGYL